MNLNGGSDPAGASRDTAPHDCTLPRLDPISLELTRE